MNIWMINHYAIPPSRAGGTRHHRLACELIKYGHQVCIIASNSRYMGSEDLLKEDEKNRFEKIDEIQYLWIKTPDYTDNAFGRFRNILSFGLSLLSLHRYDKLKKPDMVYASTPHLFTPFFAIAQARRLRIPSVIEVRDIWPDSLIELGKISSLHPVILMFRLIEKYIYKNANAIVTLLPASIPYIQRTSKSSPIICIPNGISLDLISFNVHKSEINGSKFTFMYAGAHGVANGLQCILDAVASLAGKNLNFQVRIIGQGHEKENLIISAKKLGLNNVIFEDPVPKNRIHEVMAEADAFIFILKKSPVFRWGISPNKLFDYMAVGRPILFGVETPYNPIAESQSGLTFDSDSPQDLADAIEKILSSTLLDREKMGSNAREFVNKNHDFQNLGETLNSFLQDLKMAK